MAQWYELVHHFTFGDTGKASYLQTWVNSKAAIKRQQADNLAWLAEKGHTSGAFEVTPCAKPGINEHRRRNRALA